jgi:glycosyltransferase involved in cell wall biosynthesis
VAAHPETVRFEGAISDRARLASVYGEARGFVLLSTMETLSLSTLEAAAGGCPLLLSDLPWARVTFGSQASYCPIAPVETTARCLREFYDAAPGLAAPARPASWAEIGAQFCAVYERLLGASR